MDQEFGLIVIGDEILKGKRRDRHFEAFRQMLGKHGLTLAWLQFLPDDPNVLIRQLRNSMEEKLPVFSCGGIGATPDDHTRRCAAAAAHVPLVPHPEVVTEIEAQFGADAYPNRIRMDDLPQGCELIPNPHNRIPGFFLNRHYFLPGFPEMAHPMARWVLDTQHSDEVVAERELAIKVYRTPESNLMPLLEQLTTAWPQFKLYSLPGLGPERFIELGLRGRGNLSRPSTHSARASRSWAFVANRSVLPDNACPAGSPCTVADLPKGNLVALQGTVAAGLENDQFRWA